MANFAMYDNMLKEIPSVEKYKYETIYVYEKGQCISKITGKEFKDVSERNSYVNNLTKKQAVFEVECDGVAYNSARTSQATKAGEIGEQFIRQLFEFYGVPDDNFSRHLYSLAYNRGHHAGYSEVAACFSGLADTYEEAKAFFSLKI